MSEKNYLVIREYFEENAPTASCYYNGYCLTYGNSYSTTTKVSKKELVGPFCTKKEAEAEAKSRARSNIKDIYYVAELKLKITVDTPVVVEEL